MIQALGEYGTELLHKVFNEIYETGVLPEDLTKSIFITLPKQPGAIDCELHRTISIMSHLVKILLRVVIERIRNKLLPEISEVQYGYRKDKSTINAILVLRMLGERAIEHQQDVFICFIDYSKAFDKVQHTKLIKLLEQINIDDKDLRIIKNLYWNQNAAVKVGDELSEWKSIKRGVRQGCVMSPDLFNLYSEHILRQLEDLPGISLGGNNINNIRFADDTALIAASEKKLQALLDKVVECSDKMGLTINVKKTKSMTISKKQQPPNCKLTIGQKIIEQKDKFNYLGNFLTADGKSKTAIRTRIAMAKNKFQSMKQILTNRNLSNQLKIRLLKCYIWPVLMYGCETWTITPGLKGNIEAAEMWFLRRMFKISYRDRVSNIRVLERAKTTRELLNCVQKRQLTFLGHSIRRGKLECLALEGRLEGKRSRGRQRTKFLDIMANSFEASGVTITVPEMLHCAYDRDAHMERTSLDLMKGRYWMSGKDNILVVGAHYDTDVYTKGVNDNGSGVVAMIQVIKKLRQYNHDCRYNNTVIFVAFDLSSKEYMWNFRGSESGSHSFINQYLIPKILKPSLPSARPKNFLGTIILDSVLNYNASQDTQILPQGFDGEFQDQFNAMVINRYSGNFLALIRRAWSADQLPDQINSARVVRCDKRGYMRSCHHTTCDDMTSVKPEHLRFLTHTIKVLTTVIKKIAVQTCIKGLEEEDIIDRKDSTGGRSRNLPYNNRILEGLEEEHIKNRKDSGGKRNKSSLTLTNKGGKETLPSFAASPSLILKGERDCASTGSVIWHELPHFSSRSEGGPDIWGISAEAYSPLSGFLDIAYCHPGHTFRISPCFLQLSSQGPSSQDKEYEARDTPELIWVGPISRIAHHGDISKLAKFHDCIIKLDNLAYF
ncbi:Retrovirus-related Pol polyprotein from type-1 retrotransposable element R2 [Nymphon striatum]|nr:Retrovirus-related Pol polyprotein from type-1 retrotransposable element R2 [Nymphon striatum]